MPQMMLIAAKSSQPRRLTGTAPSAAAPPGGRPRCGRPGRLGRCGGRAGARRRWPPAGGYQRAARAYGRRPSADSGLQSHARLDDVQDVDAGPAGARTAGGARPNQEPERPRPGPSNRSRPPEPEPEPQSTGTLSRRRRTRSRRDPVPPRSRTAVPRAGAAGTARTGAARDPPGARAAGRCPCRCRSRTRRCPRRSCPAPEPPPGARQPPLPRTGAAAEPELARAGAARAGAGCRDPRRPEPWPADPGDRRSGRGRRPGGRSIPTVPDPLRAGRKSPGIRTADVPGDTSCRAARCPGRVSRATRRWPVRARQAAGHRSGPARHGSHPAHDGSWLDDRGADGRT